MTPTHSPGPEPRWWWCAVAGEMSATRACDDTEWEHSLCGWQQPAASSPDEGAERPGGWVDGIGWVALLTSLPTGTYYRAHGFQIDQAKTLARWLRTATADGSLTAADFGLTAPAPTDGEP